MLAESTLAWSSPSVASTAQWCLKTTGGWKFLSNHFFWQKQFCCKSICISLYVLDRAFGGTGKMPKFMRNSVALTIPRLP